MQQHERFALPGAMTDQACRADRVRDDISSAVQAPEWPCANGVNNPAGPIVPDWPCVPNHNFPVMNEAPVRLVDGGTRRPQPLSGQVARSGSSQVYPQMRLVTGPSGSRGKFQPAERSSMSSDAIVVLKADHKEIRNLFRKFQAAGDKAVKTKEAIVGQIIVLLTVHTYIENEVMYPEVCALLPDLKDDVLESYEEHHVADVLCMELAGMPAGAERFDAKATVLIENVTHHIEEEEQDWFPKVRAGLGRKQLQELGAKLEQARKKAPRSPAQPSALKKTIDAVIA